MQWNLNEIILIFSISFSLNKPHNINFRKAIKDKVPCEQIHPPSHVLFNITILVVCWLFDSFSFLVFDLWISTQFLFFNVIMMALNSCSTIWALTFPNICQTIIAKLLIVLQILTIAYTILWALNRNFFTFQPCCYLLWPVGRSRHIII